MSIWFVFVLFVCVVAFFKSFLFVCFFADEILFLCCE